MDVHPITLTGRLVRLEPLSETHIPGLTIAGQDECIWRHLPYGIINTAEKMRQLVRSQIEMAQKGCDLPFAVIHLPSGKPIGCTRYLEISRPHRKLEIGGTWYGTEYQRTGVNTECKYLLLGHAFKILGCIRVQFKTDVRNERSQRAIERLGAVREGVLRNHMIRADGLTRDSIYYSILASEWPAVKANLKKKMERGS